MAGQKEDAVIVQRPDLGMATPLTRRDAIGRSLALAGALAAGAPHRASATPCRQATPVGDQAEAVVAIARDIMAKQAAKAVTLRVTIDGEELGTAALGESMTGVPATPDMHFRNGAVAIFYVATLLLRLVDQKAIALDDTVATWRPDLPNADTVTLRMLTNMTSGYPDFVQNPQLAQEFYANPFRQWTTEERLAIAFSTPPWFAPGANWGYAHTNYLILAQVLEQVTGQPLDVALQEQVLGPMGLHNTVNWTTPTIPEPALHAFSSERREALRIPDGVRFSEESTFWNPSWTFAKGAIQTTNIVDMTTTAEAVGEGTLLSAESHREQIAPKLLGFGSPLAGCPSCHTLDTAYSYGLGVAISGDWILQNPLFGGYGAVAGYLPPQKIAVAVATTFGEGAFADDGSYRHKSFQDIFGAIGSHLALDHPVSLPNP
jgi:CubicO group peptidase (beta-lactamase class C family)